MNWKLLIVPTSLFAISASLALACEPCEGDECKLDSDGGGEPGDGSGGKASGGMGGNPATGGTAPGGSSATGGSSLGGEGGSAASLDCQEDGSPEGTPGSCEPLSEPGDQNYECEACVQEFCCSEFEACNASGPKTSCRFGSTLLAGFPVEGEFDCMLACLRDVDYFYGDETQMLDCADQCGSSECNPGKAGLAAQELVACMLGYENTEYPLGCQDACKMGPTD